MWAHLINMKHQSFDDPPDKPFFSVSSKKVFKQKSSDIPNATGMVMKGFPHLNELAFALNFWLNWIN